MKENPIRWFEIYLRDAQRTKTKAYWVRPLGGLLGTYEPYAEL